MIHHCFQRRKKEIGYFQFSDNKKRRNDRIDVFQTLRIQKDIKRFYEDEYICVKAELII
jgi:hypothetical protein